MRDERISRGLIGLACTGLFVLLATGCGTEDPKGGLTQGGTTGGDPDVGTGSDDVGKEDTGPEVDTKPQPAPGTCGIVIGAPTYDGIEAANEAGIHTLPPKTLSLKVQAGHQEANKVLWTKAKAGLAKPDGTVDVLDQPALAIAKDEENNTTIASFTLELDAKDWASGKYCVQVAAFTEYPEGSPEGWPETPPSCIAEQCFTVDSDCPFAGPIDVLVGGDPNDPIVKEGPYLGELPIEFVSQDVHTGVKSITLKLGDEVLREYPLAGTGLQQIKDTLDVCAQGTGVVTYTLETVDLHDNTCSIPLEPRIIRCPAYVSTQLLDTAGAVASHMVEVDFEGTLDYGDPSGPVSYAADDLLDLVIITQSGTYLLHNLGGKGFAQARQLPDLPGGRAVIADDLNGDDRTDLVLMTPGSDEDAVMVFIQGPVGTPLEGWQIDGLAEGAPVPEFHPVATHEGFGLAEAHPIPAEITAHRYARFAFDDKTYDGETPLDKTEDLIIGTNEDAYALAVLSRAEDGDIKWTDGEDEKSAHACSYFQKRWDVQGEPLPPLPHHEAVACFRTPKWVASLAGINWIELGNWHEATPAKDVAVSRFGSNKVSVYKHDGLGHLEVAASTTLGKDLEASQVIGGLFNDDLHSDLLVVLPGQGQLWQWRGTGNGKFEVEPAGPDGQPYVARRAVCIEGSPQYVVQTFMDDYDLPQQVRDLVVANGATGTLWTMLGAGVGAGYKETRVVDIIASPEQLIVKDINNDGAPDAIARNKEGLIGIVYGAHPSEPPEWPSTHPLVGPKGSFIGAQAVTTPIQVQAPGASISCDESNLANDGSASLGTPENRLTPRLVLFDHFDASDSKVDMVIITDAVESATPEGPGPKKQPLLTYTSDNTSPTVFSEKTDLCAFTMECIDDVHCETQFGALKQPATDAVSASFNLDGTVDLAFGTSTFYNSTNEPKEGEVFPELATVDVAFNEGAGDFEQLTKTAKYPPDEWPWIDKGLLAGSRPFALAALHCHGESDVLADLAVLAERSSESGVINLLKVYGGNPGKQFNQPYDHKFLPGEVATGLRAVRLGSVDDPGDPQPDLLVTTKTGVFIFTGDDGCSFIFEGENNIGQGVSGVAARDLNGDGFAEIVSPLLDGTIAILESIDGVAFFEADYTLKIDGNVDLTSPEIEDLNGDGFLDIVVLDKATDTLLVLPGTGVVGEIWGGAPYVIPVAVDAKSYNVVDLDGDGCKDLAVLSPETKAVSMLRNKTLLVAPECVLDNVLPL